eukprot:13340035-Alexandrium_andersonii.AAC.1
MPDDWQPPDWFEFEFGGENAELGAIVLHAAADEARVMADAERFCREFDLDDRCRQHLLTRPAKVIDAVVHRAHGWGNALSLIHI